MESYQELEVWKRGMRLAELVYKLSQHFPKSELYGMTSQMRRAAASIPANIAEGWARRSPKEFQHFINIANGSLRELETHLLLSQRVGLTEAEVIQPALEEIAILGKQLLSLHRSLSRRTS